MTIITVPATPQGPTSWVQVQADRICAEVEGRLATSPVLPILRQLVAAGWGAGLNWRPDGTCFVYCPDVVGDEPQEVLDACDAFYEREKEIISYLKDQQYLWREALSQYRARLGNAAFNPVYRAYLQSFAWSLFRQYALVMSENMCAECKATGVTLQVHHLSYKRIGWEDIDDVAVLCVPCHEQADQDRAEEVYDRGLDTWATKVYGSGWENRVSYRTAVARFEAWKARKRNNW